MKIEDFAEAVCFCEDEEELNKILSMEMAYNGYENWAITMLGNGVPEVLGGDLPGTWAEDYMAEGLYENDPVFHAMMNHRMGSYTWDTTYDETSDRKSHIVMEEAKLNGIKDGITVTLPSLGRQLNGAFSAREDIDEREKRAVQAKAFAMFSMYSKKREMLKAEHSWLEVTPRETEVIKWVAKGCTNEEISLTLGIHKRTVETLLRRVCERNNLSKRLEIVQIATLQGLIDIG